jgi:hypothetical protein
MTAINFPDTPSLGDTFTVGSFTWEWDGTVWRSLSTAVAPAEEKLSSFLLMGA